MNIINNIILYKLNVNNINNNSNILIHKNLNVNNINIKNCGEINNTSDIKINNNLELNNNNIINVSSINDLIFYKSSGIKGTYISYYPGTSSYALYGDTFIKKDNHLIFINTFNIDITKGKIISIFLMQGLYVVGAFNAGIGFFIGKTTSCNIFIRYDETNKTSYIYYGNSTTTEAPEDGTCYINELYSSISF